MSTEAKQNALLHAIYDNRGTMGGLAAQLFRLSDAASEMGQDRLSDNLDHVGEALLAAAEHLIEVHSSDLQERCTETARSISSTFDAILGLASKAKATTP